MKVYVFKKDFLTDYSDGLGVVIADSKPEAISKMAYLVSSGYEESIADNIREYSKLDIKEYTLENFPGVYTFGGA